MRRSTSIVISALLFLFCATGSLKAQWQKKASFSCQVTCVYFLDAEQKPEIGFAGLINGEIWRTSNQGASWKLVSTTAPGERISTFTFKDNLTGWCTLWTNATINGCFATLDGGLTWTVVPNTANCPLVSYYHKPAARLFLNYWSRASEVSKTNGDTWSTYLPAKVLGMAFADAYSGVISTFWQTYYYTTDGGATWKPSNLRTEGWHPLAIAGTHTYFACAEGSNDIYRSNDGGATWNTISTIGNMGVATGDIRGVLNRLYVQTDQGFCVSTDQGASWGSICGPSATKDCSFYVENNAIIAGDQNGGLWYNPTGLQSTSVYPIELSKSIIQLYSHECNVAETVVKLVNPGNCALYVVSEKLVGSHHFALASNFQPHYIMGEDSIPVAYIPNGTSRETAELHVQYRIGPLGFDTVIKLIGLREAAFHVLLPNKQFSATLAHPCSRLDTAVTLRNFGCDTLIIASATLTDKSVFSLNKLTLPIKIAPQASIELPIECFAHASGSYTSTLKLGMQIDAATHDTSINLALNVGTASRPIIQQLTATVSNPCVRLDTTIEIGNTLCDTIRLISATIPSGVAITLGALTFPIAIAPGATIAIPVRGSATAKGLYGAELHLGLIEGTQSFDTMVRLSLQVVSDQLFIPRISASNISFPVTSICASRDTVIRFANTSCSDWTVKSAVASDPNFLTLCSAPYPHVLQSGAEDSLILRFAPSVSGTKFAQVKISFESEQHLFDTALTVAGIGSSTIAITLASPSLTFTSATRCEIREAVTSLTNNNCEAVQFTEAAIGNADYKVSEPAVGTWIEPQQTIAVKVVYAPVNSGASNTKIELRLRSRTGTEARSVLSVNGISGAETAPLSISATAMKLVANPCHGLDTTIVFSNPRRCDFIKIEQVTVTGTAMLGMQWFGGASVSLSAGAVLSVSLHVSGRELTQGEDTLHVEYEGRTILIPIHIEITKGEKMLALASVDTIFRAKQCSSIRKSFTVYNTGCDTLPAPSFSLTSDFAGQTQFAIPAPSTTPRPLAPGDSLTVFVTFDPEANGNGSAMLVIHSEDANFSRRYMLQGVVLAPHSAARLGVFSSAGTLQATNAPGQTTYFNVASKDSINSESGLNEVAFTLHFDGDILTKSDIQLLPGWSVASEVEAPGSIRYLLKGDLKRSLAPMDHIASIGFYVTESQRASTPVTITEAAFNGADSLFDRCVLSAVSSEDTLNFTTARVCGDSAMRSFLAGEPIISLISVAPNPVTLAAASTGNLAVTLSLQREGAVYFTLYDLLGRVSGEPMTVHLTAGMHQIGVPYRFAAEGTYFLKLEAVGAEKIRKVLVRKD
jgi:hypothetical protein